MIDANQIPDEVVEAAAKAIYEAWCAFHGVTKTSMPWEEIDDEERQACIAEARASIVAAINAWPDALGHGDLAPSENGPPLHIYNAIILPLPQENANAEG